MYDERVSQEDMDRAYEQGYKKGYEDGVESERPRAFGDGYEAGYDNALKLVRCKDCKHYNFETHGCKRNPSVEPWWEDDFCLYGEKQVTGKLNNADDSLLTEYTEMDKEQKSKLESEKVQLSPETPTNKADTPTNTPTNTPTEDCISRQEAIDMVSKYHKAFVYDSDVDELIVELESLPPSEPRSVCEDAISRQVAIEAIEKAYCNPCKERGDDYNEVRCRACNFDDAISQIDAVPPVEPKRPKGEWIEYIDDRNGRRYVKCSSCNKSTLNAIEYDVLDGERYIMDFCPKCGADMRGNDYQRHIEDLEHFMRYETTYNPEDGSM